MIDCSPPLVEPDRAGRRGIAQRLGVLSLVLAVLGGMFAGMSTFTFTYGEGGSYFSEDPRACTNCHIMDSHFDSWVKSSHHAVATCTDCHLPHDFVGKYLSKADNGFFHSWMFTFDNFHEPIQIKPRNRRILEHNCIACHEEIVDTMRPVAHGGEMRSCMDCHSDVGHAANR